MDKNKNEELQSRREFFKSAAKAALPVIGAIMLSHLPISAQAEETGCANNCGYGCAYNCAGTCKGGCYQACTGTCTWTCSGSCSSSSRR
ncbi:MAG: Cys-Xaa-Xaa-Xaa repeat radical SAM target protein [Paludibacteraceae bacterium]|nr:Cys-Xaa-Xaa-Xaa repeat radical SAM target protein [Paludibacteraceae bacterium]